MNEREHGGEDTLGRTERDRDLLFRIRHAPVAARELDRDLLAQLRHTDHRRVLVVACRHVIGNQVLQSLGRVEIGKSLRQIDRAELACAIRHHGEDRGADVWKLGTHRAIGLRSESCSYRTRRVREQVFTYSRSAIRLISTCTFAASRASPSWRSGLCIVTAIVPGPSTLPCVGTMKEPGLSGGNKLNTPSRVLAPEAVSKSTTNVSASFAGFSTRETTTSTNFAPPSAPTGGSTACRTTGCAKSKAYVAAFSSIEAAA